MAKDKDFLPGVTPEQAARPPYLEATTQSWTVGAEYFNVPPGTIPPEPPANQETFGLNPVCPTPSFLERMEALQQSTPQTQPPPVPAKAMEIEP